jgi:hypothetical protein
MEHPDRDSANAEFEAALLQHSNEFTEKQDSAIVSKTSWPKAISIFLGEYHMLTKS